MHLIIEATFDKVLRTMEDIPSAVWEVPAPEGKWSLSQVFEHILISSALPPDLCRGEPDRFYDSKVEEIGALLRKENVPWNCPLDWYPFGVNSQKDDLLSHVEICRDQLSTYSKDEDLSLLCLDRALSPFGFLTRYEWLYFICGHAERHLSQAKGLCSSIY
jgi:hypothetical protein